MTKKIVLTILLVLIIGALFFPIHISSNAHSWQASSLLLAVYHCKTQICKANFIGEGGPWTVFFVPCNRDGTLPDWIGRGLGCFIPKWR